MQQATIADETFPFEAAPAELPHPDPRVARLASALLELDEEHRIVLCLHFLERLTMEEIAVVLDDTVECVRAVYGEAVVMLGGMQQRKRDAA